MSIVTEQYTDSQTHYNKYIYRHAYSHSTTEQLKLQNKPHISTATKHTGTTYSSAASDIKLFKPNHFCFQL